MRSITFNSFSNDILRVELASTGVTRATAAITFACKNLDGTPFEVTENYVLGANGWEKQVDEAARNLEPNIREKFQQLGFAERSREQRDASLDRETLI